MASWPRNVGYMSGDTPASAMAFPAAFTRPAMGATAAAPPSESGVPDLPCPKCGHPDVRIAYCDSSPTLRPWSSVVQSLEDDYCGKRDPEHFHRSCRRCSYRWRTDDTLGRHAGA